MEQKTLDTQQTISTLIERLEVIDKERQEIHEQLRSLNSSNSPDKHNSSGEYLLERIEEYIAATPHSSKLKLSQLLSISQGRLYDLINGKRMISSAIFKRVCGVLQLTFEQSNQLRFKIDNDKRNRKTTRSAAKEA